VTRVELTELARQDLDSLVQTRELPASTYARVADSLESLRIAPLAGRALAGRYDGLRLVVGPWGWIALLYEYLEADDLVLVVGVMDGRSRGAPNAS